MKLFEVTNTTWENLQIAKHKSVQCAKWMTLICALRFADFLRLCLSPRTTSRTICFSISNSFYWGEPQASPTVTCWLGFLSRYIYMGRLMGKGTQCQNFQLLFFHGFSWRIQRRNQRRKPLEKISRHHKVTALFVTRVYMHINGTSRFWSRCSPLCGCGRCVPFRMSRPIYI